MKLPLVTSTRKLVTTFRNSSVITKVTVGGVFAAVAIAGTAVAMAAQKPAQQASQQNAAAQVKSASTVKDQANGMPKADANTNAASPNTVAATTSQPAASPVAKPQANKPAPAATPAPKPTTGSPTPAPIPKPTPKPPCLGCNGDPDKTPTHTGALIVSGGPVTIQAGSYGYSGLTARSDSGEAISLVYVVYGADSPMIMTSFAPDAYSVNYSAQRSFGFNVNMNVEPGTYNLQFTASSASGGRFTGYATVIVTAP